MLWTSLFLAAALGAGDRARESGELRVHELGALLVPGRSELALQFAPCRGGPDAAPGEETCFDAGIVIELVRSLCAPEFEFEGRRLEEREGRLFVVAPAPVQEKVARLLGFLAGALGTQVELCLEELVLGEVAAKDPPLLLGPDEAQRLAATALQRRSFVLGTRPGWIASGGNTRPTSILGSWSVEIAQAAAIHDPVVEAVPLGAQYGAAAAGAAGGAWISLLARSAESSGPKDHPLEFASALAAELGSLPNPRGGAPSTRTSGRSDQPGPRLWQSLPLGLHALAVNSFLPDGKVLCLASTLGAGDDRTTHLLLVRRLGRVGAPAASFSFDEKAPGRDLVLVDTGWISPPLAEVYGELAAGGALPMIESEQGPLAARLRVPQAGLAHDLLGASGGLDCFDSASWLVLARSARPVEGSGIDSALARLTRCAPEALGFGVALHLRHGANSVARGTLALRLGAESLFACGAEDELLFDWDVEVAQGASTAQPQVHTSFEGLCARVRVERDATGTLRLALKAFGQVRAAELRNLDPQVATIGAITLPSWERLRLDERVTLPAQGPRRAVFGDAGGQGLVLELEITDLR